MPRKNQVGVLYRANCPGGRKYIGWTQNPEDRFDAHFNGYGAKFTQQYRPYSIKVLGVGTKDDEKYLTELEMQQRGVAKVRGGPWTARSTKTLRRFVPRYLK